MVINIYLKINSHFLFMQLYKKKYKPINLFAYEVMEEEGLS